MTTTTPNHRPQRPRRTNARPTGELVERFLEAELSEADEGFTERALVEMLEQQRSLRPSRCFAGNVIRCIEEEDRAASCWSRRTVTTLIAVAIALCGSGVLLLGRLAGLPAAPSLDWLPILRAAWVTVLESPSFLATVLARFGGSWADARSAVAWAYSPQLLLLAGTALSFATLALGALARLMDAHGPSEQSESQRVTLDPVDVEAAG